MSFYLFIAISFYRKIAILCVKMSWVNKALILLLFVHEGFWVVRSQVGLDFDVQIDLLISPDTKTR